LAGALRLRQGCRTRERADLGACRLGRGNGGGRTAGARACVAPSRTTAPPHPCHADRPRDRRRALPCAGAPPDPVLPAIRPAVRGGSVPRPATPGLRPGDGDRGVAEPHARGATARGPDGGRERTPVAAFARTRT